MPKTKTSGLLLLLLGCALAPPEDAAAELRKFTLERTGTEFEAELIDVKVGRVTIRHKGKNTDTDTESFIRADREYFREWVAKRRGIYDWPNERGLKHDGSTLEALPDGEPKVAWRAEVGLGDGSVVVGNGRVAAAGVRDGRLVLTVFSPFDGTPHWTKDYKIDGGGAGAAAEASPTIDVFDDLVYTLGPRARLDCRNSEDGAIKWAHKLRQKYPQARFAPGGNLSSPITNRGSLLQEIGPPAYSLVSFAAINGGEEWRIGKGQSLGVTPVIGQFGDVRTVVVRSSTDLIGRDAKNGIRRWGVPWSGTGDASPLPLPGGRVFVTSKEKCTMFKLHEEKELKELWSSSELCSTDSTPVFYAGYLFGFDGKNLRCLDANTGKVEWSVESFGPGQIVRAAEKLVIQTGLSGELVIAAAESKAYRELTRTKVFDGESGALPVVATGKIYCRSRLGDLTCLELKKGEEAK